MPPGDASPDLINFYLWNVTNVAAVRDGAKPVLQQLGPYMYRKWRARQDVRFDRAGLVSFADFSYITPHAVAGARDPALDVVYTLNLPLMGVLRTIELRLTGAVQALAELALAEVFGDHGAREGLFMRRTAAELLFGYEDEILASLARVLPTLALRTTFRLVENMTDPDAAAQQPHTVMDTGAGGHSCAALGSENAG